MGNRLSKIVTKTGDSGTTGISGNIRLAKYHPRIETIGLVDELNSLIGIGIAEIQQQNDSLTPSAQSALTTIIDEWALIQHELFNLGGELSMPGTELITADAVEKIENWLTNYNDELPPLKEFILPGGSVLVANTHYIRAISRKAERSLWALNSSGTDAVNPHSLKFLNRLSDYYFIIARTIAKITNTPEVFWKKNV